MTADDRRPGPPLPPSAHPDLDTLADLHAGALDPATADRVRGHVSSCPQCSGVLSALDAVQGELRGLPAPPIPAAVAARLDATLADLRRGDLATSSRPDSRRPTAIPADASTGAPTDGSTGAPTGASEGSPTGASADGPAGGAAGGSAPAPVGDLGVAREKRHRRLTRSLGAVAAAVAVIAAGASVTALVRTGGSDNATSTSGAAGSAAGSGAGSGDSAARPAPEASGAKPNLGATVPSYDKDTLRAALPSIAQQSAVGKVAGRGDAGPAGAMSDAARRTACAGTIQGSSGRLSAVQRIVYEGKPAYVFVFDDNGRPTAFVVSDECGTSPALPASVLDTVS